MTDPLTLALFIPLFGAMAGFAMPRAVLHIGLVAVLANAGAVAALVHQVVGAG